MRAERGGTSSESPRREGESLCAPAGPPGPAASGLSEGRRAHIIDEAASDIDSIRVAADLDSIALALNLDVRSALSLEAAAEAQGREQRRQERERRGSGQKKEGRAGHGPERRESNERATGVPPRGDRGAAAGGSPDRLASLSDDAPDAVRWDWVEYSVAARVCGHERGGV